MVVVSEDEGLTIAVVAEVESWFVTDVVEMIERGEAEVAVERSALTGKVVSGIEKDLDEDIHYVARSCVEQRVLVNVKVEIVDKVDMRALA